jgi:CO/xanthine dehydrogenase Mo-binding subunit
MTDGNIIGKNVPRVDARGKVTGQTKFAGDLRLPGMHYGKIVFSPHPRARVLEVDCRVAESMPGVRKVITARDLPGSNRYGYIDAHQPVLVQVGEDTQLIDTGKCVVLPGQPAALRMASA